MHGGHQTLQDGEVVIDNLRQRREAVGGARCVGDHVHVVLILLLVDSHHEHRGIGGGSGDDDLLSAAREMSGGPGCGGEHPGALNHVLGPGAGPGDALRVSLAEDGDSFAIDRQFAALGLANLNISSVVSKMS